MEQERVPLSRASLGSILPDQVKSFLRKKILPLSPRGKKSFQESDILPKIQEYLQSSPWKKILIFRPGFVERERYLVTKKFLLFSQRLRISWTGKGLTSVAERRRWSP